MAVYAPSLLMIIIVGNNGDKKEHHHRQRHCDHTVYSMYNKIVIHIAVLFSMSLWFANRMQFLYKKEE